MSFAICPDMDVPLLLLRAWRDMNYGSLQFSMKFSPALTPGWLIRDNMRQATQLAYPWTSAIRIPVWFPGGYELRLS
jgi:hypothetical protein